MIVDVIAGARPNFIKIAALFSVSDGFPSLDLRFVHTGQHYDANLSDTFVQELELPQPVCNLNVGSGPHGRQTAEIMNRYEQWVEDNRPDCCVVVGDVNSTLACGLVAVKMGVRLAHVEAGLRSQDRTMPEEINRVVTDSVSDLLFASEPSGVVNLAREGRPAESIHLVGNVMVDTLFRLQAQAKRKRAWRSFSVAPKEYVYVTLHRPSNVDHPADLEEICGQLLWLASKMDIIFPVHPRTLKNLKRFGLHEQIAGAKGIHLTEPMSYLASISLAMNAKLVVTDSGGLQEETTALNVPCLTLRESTERPITVTDGTNSLIRKDFALFRKLATEILAGAASDRRKSVPYWDGKAGERILEVLGR